MAWAALLLFKFFYSGPSYASKFENHCGKAMSTYCYSHLRSLLHSNVEFHHTLRYLCTCGIANKFLTYFSQTGRNGKTVLKLALAF